MKIFLAIALVFLIPRFGYATCSDKFGREGKPLNKMGKVIHSAEENTKIYKELEESKTSDSPYFARSYIETIQQGLLVNFPGVTGQALLTRLEAGSRNLSYTFSFGKIDGELLKLSEAVELIGLLFSEKPRQTRELTYIEDHQGFSFTTVIFETDFPGPLANLEKVSKIPPGSGRFSTSYFTFRDLVRAAGYKCEFIRALQTDQKPPAGFQVVEGETGNY